MDRANDKDGKQDERVKAVIERDGQRGFSVRVTRR
jgi:hypothetical protein